MARVSICENALIVCSSSELTSPRHLALEVVGRGDPQRLHMLDEPILNMIERFKLLVDVLGEQ